MGLLPAGALDAFRALLGDLYLPLAAVQLGDGSGGAGAVDGGSLSVLQVRGMLSMNSMSCSKGSWPDDVAAIMPHV